MTIDEIMRSPNWFRLGPIPRPDLSDGTAFSKWIRSVRNIAFLAGARGNQIDEIEAIFLFPYIELRKEMS